MKALIIFPDKPPEVREARYGGFKGIIGCEYLGTFGHPGDAIGHVDDMALDRNDKEPVENGLASWICVRLGRLRAGIDSITGTMAVTGIKGDRLTDVPDWMVRFTMATYEDATSEEETDLPPLPECVRQEWLYEKACSLFYENA
jgi:hypothetical protein